MFFNRVPLRNKIIQLILDNPIPYRSTDILSPYLILSITLFFSRYKSVIVNELYYKGLIELHGDVELFLKAKSTKDTKYLRIAATLTSKGMAYYKLHMQKPEPKEVTESTSFSELLQPRHKPTLSIVR